MRLVDAALGAAAAGVLLFPGWLIARAYKLTQPLLGGFIVSAVALLGVVLAFDAVKIPLTVGPLMIAWALFIALTAWAGRKLSKRPRAPEPHERLRWREQGVLLLPLLPMAVVVMYRACAQPLFGVDTVFRWNYLAEQMLSQRSLGFYPPVSAADYEIYSWPDGIAPLVSSLYLFTYAIAGATRATLSAPLVVVQFALVVAGAYAVARNLFSARAGVFTAALLACSPLVAWATTMGQETGLMAIAFLGVLLYLPQSRDEESTSRTIFAGLAAACGALAREYGLALLAVGFGLCLARRLSFRTCVTFVSVSALAALPWYARNWMHTGNPLFNLALGDWFPLNEAHAALNTIYAAEFGWSNLPPDAPRILLVNCLAGLLAGIVGGLLHLRRAPSIVVTILVVVVLWIASLGYTAAGFIYSLRVLNPALVLAAVLGGAALAHFIPGKKLQTVAVLGLSLFGMDAAVRMLTLPGNVYRIPPREWFRAGNALHEYHQRPIYSELARVAGQDRMLVLGPNALLTKNGARTVPLWSPDMAFLFDPTLSPPEVARRLRTADVGFVLLNRGPVNERFLARSAFFRDPAGTLQPVWSDPDMVLLRVAAPPAR